MRILIVHQSQLRLARVRHQVVSVHPSAAIMEAASLSDTYHLSEHANPDCVFISEELASHAEFELLTALLSILDITCLVMSQSVAETQPHHVYRGITIVPENALDDALKRTLRVPQPTAVSEKGLKKPPTHPGAYDPDRIILVGASTGGIDALLNVTQGFDYRCPPTLIVQHTSGSFLRSLVTLLDGASPATVVPAEHEMQIKTGHIYLAPDDRAHLTITPGRSLRIALAPGAPISGHRPSIDALFASALPVAEHVSAALLTGMGKDGAEGLTRLRQAGAHTIAQDQPTSVVYGMPRVALEMGGVCAQLPIRRIGPALLQSCRERRRA